jgi:F-type H+-transporting ATPase subunit a
MRRRWKLIVALVSVTFLFVVGLVFGKIGTSLFGIENPPSWLAQKDPEFELPAPELFSIGPLDITNTMLASWLTMLVLIVLFLAATRRMKLVPGRLQALVEWVVGTLLEFAEDIAGRENGRRFFPVIATIFLFVMFNSYLALMPFFGESIYVHVGGHEWPLLRSASTDLNLPLSMAVIAVLFVEYWGMSTLKARPYLSSNFFNFGPLFGSLRKLFTGKIGEGLGGLLTGFIKAFVGFLELVSHGVRIVSFAFRLFGNMTAGEILLVVISYLVLWVVPLPFYGLELLVGFVQALIFASLTLVFAAIAVTPHEHEEE